MRVLLINPGNDYQKEVANYAAFPPLNILSLASTAKDRLKDVKVKVCDGQINRVDDINYEMSEFEPDVVGISVLSGSYRNAISHAQFAKNLDPPAQTILGNDHAAIYGENILTGENGQYFDYICKADVGEIVFCDFLRMLRQKGDRSKVPKLMYLEPNGKIHNDKTHGFELDPDPRWLPHVLDQIPLVDWSLIEERDMDKYRYHYKEVYGDILKGIDGQTTAVTINRARGCGRDVSGSRCLYCGIANLVRRTSSPDMFWKEVKAAKDKVKANIFYEACDSLDSFSDWVGQLVVQKRKELQTQPDLDDVRFFVYSNALGIARNDKLLELFRKLGVFMVNMGLDSGDDEMLRRLKGWADSVQVNDEAIERLRGARINIYASFVLGAPGETEGSLRNTIEYAESLIKDHKLAAIEVQPLYPLFNAKAGEWLLDTEEAKRGAEKMRFTIRDIGKLKEMKRTWGRVEDPDPEAISKDWVDIFCNVSYERLKAARDEIGECARDEHVHFGTAF